MADSTDRLRKESSLIGSQLFIKNPIYDGGSPSNKYDNIIQAYYDDGGDDENKILIGTGTMTIGADVTIQGSLQVEGDSNIYSGETVLADNVMTLNDVDGSSGRMEYSSGANSEGAGIAVRTSDPDTYEHFRLFNASGSFPITYTGRSSDVWYTLSDVIMKNLYADGDVFFTYSSTGGTSLDTILTNIANNSGSILPFTTYTGQTYQEGNGTSNVTDIADVEFSQNIAISTVLENNPVLYSYIVDSSPYLYSDSGPVEYAIDLPAINLDDLVSGLDLSSEATTKVTDVMYSLSMNMDNTHVGTGTRDVVVGFYNDDNVLQYPLLNLTVAENTEATINEVGLKLPLLYWYGDSSNLTVDSGGRQVILNIDEDLEVGFELKVTFKLDSFISTSDYVTES